MARISTILALLLGGMIGCGGSANTTTIEGAVKFRGEPLADGSITFFPSKGDRPVGASLDESGEYSINLSPGDYTVVVQAPTPPRPEGWTEFDPLPPPKVRLPPKYTTRAKSGLTAPVSKGQQAPINFDLR